MYEIGFFASKWVELSSKIYSEQLFATPGAQCQESPPVLLGSDSPTFDYDLGFDRTKLAHVRDLELILGDSKEETIRDSP